MNSGIYNKEDGWWGKKMQLFKKKLITR